MSVSRKANISCTIITVACCILAILSVIDVIDKRSKIAKWRGPGNLRCLFLSLEKRSDRSPLRPRIVFPGNSDDLDLHQILLDPGSLLVLWSPPRIPKKAIVFAQGHCGRYLLIGQAEKEWISLAMDECPGDTCTNAACQEVHALLNDTGPLRSLEDFLERTAEENE